MCMQAKDMQAREAGRRTHEGGLAGAVRQRGGWLMVMVLRGLGQGM